MDCPRISLTVRVGEFRAPGIGWFNTAVLATAPSPSPFVAVPAARRWCEAVRKISLRDVSEEDESFSPAPFLEWLLLLPLLVWASVILLSKEDDCLCGFEGCCDCDLLLVLLLLVLVGRFGLSWREFPLEGGGMLLRLELLLLLLLLLLRLGLGKPLSVAVLLLLWLPFSFVLVLLLFVALCLALSDVLRPGLCGRLILESTFVVGLSDGFESHLEEELPVLFALPAEWALLALRLEAQVEIVDLV